MAETLNISTSIKQRAFLFYSSEIVILLRLRENYTVFKTEWVLYFFFPYCRIAYIEFKTEADAEKTLEEKQGTEIDGRSISLYYTGEKGQSQDHRGGKNSTWSGKNLGFLLGSEILEGKEILFIFVLYILDKLDVDQHVIPLFVIVLNESYMKYLC